MKTPEKNSKLALLAAVPVMVLALAVALGTLTGQAVAAPAGKSNNTFAVGGITMLDGHVAFAAQLNPQNGNVSGHVVQDSMGISRSGPVTCLTVLFIGTVGHATVEWTVEHSDNSVEIGQTRAFEVTDNPDLFFERVPGLCSSFTNIGTPPIHGNIVVKGP